ncbi:extracellular solute-binding protein [Lactiplantibacillus pentosus]|uniref:extracellular solute-binding protein n=1 Tax=Lactiplantibacillus pentosus TaxID=1589 RepID=UPI000B53C193|nr:extracellular solute-binding protein [Lactiplantibacillus pentosus]ASG79900.1 ABC transporter substrate-binding protein [Lactiplantibacillus pentosus]
MRKIVLCITACLILFGMTGCHQQKRQQSAAKISIMAPYLTSSAPAKDGIIVKKLERMTKTKLNIKWVTNASYSDKVNVTMAGSKLPDIIVFKDKDAAFIKYAQAGDFWNLTKYLKKYPNLARANQQVLRNSSINGQVYGIYRARDIMRASVTLRKDWLKKLKLKTPDTLAELTTVMQKFTDEDPDGDGKNDTYGMLVNRWYGLNNGAPWEIVATWLGAPNGWGEKPDGTLYPAFMSPAYLKSLKWFRKQIRAGYINPDFSTDTDSLSASFLRGVGGSYIQPAYAMADLSELTSDQQLVKKYTFTGNLPATSNSSQHSWATSGYSGLLAIPKASVRTKAELNRVLRFIDETCSKKGQVLINNGISGVNFKVSASDKQYAQPINVQQQKYQKIVTETSAISQIKTGVNEANQPYRLVSKTLQPLANKRYGIMATDQRNAVYNKAAPYVSKTYSQKGAVLDEIIDDAQIRYMAGKINDHQWHQVIKKWLSSGGQKVIDEYSTLNKRQ